MNVNVNANDDGNNDNGNNDNGIGNGDLGPMSKKHKASPPCGSEIIDQRLFQASFPDITVGYLNEIIPVTWNNAEGRDKIYHWLSHISIGLATCHKLIKKESYVSVIPFLLEVIKPTVILANNLSFTVDIKDIDRDVIDEACRIVAENNSRNNTMRSSSSSIDEDAVDSTSVMVDITNRENLRDIYISIKQQIMSTLPINGRVEFAFFENNMKKMIIEAKRVMFTDRPKGFWQTCTEMLLISQMEGYKSAVVKGIYTDFDNWQFLMFDIEERRIRKSKEYTFSSFEGQFVATSIEVMMLLFEFFEIPPSIDIVDSFDHIVSSTKETADLIMENLYNERNIELERQKRIEVELELEKLRSLKS